VVDEAAANRFAVACPLRASQRRHSARLAVVWRDPAKGWGLESRQAFAPGDAVGDYTGEAISSAEAKRRQARRDGTAGSARSATAGTVAGTVAKGFGGAGNYVLTVDEVFGGTTLRTCVDAARWGGAGRFANHSCAANCAVKAVRAGSRVPALVLVAQRAIAAGEELTLDYGSGGPAANEHGGQKNSPAADDDAPARIRCRCGEVSCRGYLPYDP
jgi:SET domain-containing protein